MNFYSFMGFVWVMAICVTFATRYPWSTWWRIASPPIALIAPALAAFAGHRDSASWIFSASSFGIGCVIGIGGFALARAGLLNIPITHPRRAIAIIVAMIAVIYILGIIGVTYR